MHSYSLHLTFLDAVPSLCSADYWKGVFQNAIGCTIGSFLAIYVSYRIYMNQSKHGREERELQERQQNSDTLSYFKGVVKDIIRIVRQQVDELNKYIKATKENSLNIEPLTYLPLFQLKHIANGDSMDQTLVAYIRQFPGEKSVKEFSGIRTCVEYLYSQLLLFPEETRRAIQYDYERKIEYQKLHRDCYGLLGEYMLRINPAQPTPGAIALQEVMENFAAHHTDNYDLEIYHQYFFIPINDVMVTMLAGIEINAIFVQLAQMTRDGKQLFAYIKSQNEVFAKSLEEMMPKITEEVKNLENHAQTIMAWSWQSMSSGELPR